MTKFGLLRLKNQMLIGNFISNIIGVNIVNVISRRSISPATPEVMELANRINMVFLPLSFFMMICVTIYYEKPIRLYLNNAFREISNSQQITQKARRRLLNEPFFLIAGNLLVWLIAAVVYSSIIWVSYADPMIVGRRFVQSLFVGIITTTVAFFILEYIL